MHFHNHTRIFQWENDLCLSKQYKVSSFCLLLLPSNFPNWVFDVWVTSKSKNKSINAFIKVLSKYSQFSITWNLRKSNSTQITVKTLQTNKKIYTQIKKRQTFHFLDKQTYLIVQNPCFYLHYSFRFFHYFVPLISSKFLETRSFLIYVRLYLFRI